MRRPAWPAVALCLAGVVVAYAPAATSAADPPARSVAGVVSSATPEATAAGVEILEAGGNAIDAAIAVALALGVSEPAGSGIGGQAYLLVQAPGRTPVVVAGSTRAPGALPGRIAPEDVVGRRASTVPSTLKVLGSAFERLGSGRIAWPRLVAPAIRHAELGYPIGHFRQRSLARYARRIANDAAAARALLRADGSVPRLGDRVPRPELARTLQRIATAGPEDFYKGEIARSIAADMRRHGGWISLEDLAAYPEPQQTSALESSYRGYAAYSLPPPTGGWVVLQALNLLELSSRQTLLEPTSRRVWLAETLRLAHSSRLATPLSDPAEPGSAVATMIDKQHARALAQELDAPGWTPPAPGAGPPTISPAGSRGRGGETTHFCVVDGQGVTVAATLSLNGYFGAKVAHPELGFLYNDYMREFELDVPGHPYALRPRGLPYSSMSATIVSRDGSPVLAVGSPGSKRIISAVVQVISHWVDVAEGIEAAVAAPRLHVLPPDDLFVEERGLGARGLLELELRGYDVVRPLSSLHKGDLSPFFGGVHAVALEGAEWTGAADPRRDGTVGLATR